MIIRFPLLYLDFWKREACGSQGPARRKNKPGELDRGPFGDAFLLGSHFKVTQAPESLLRGSRDHTDP